MYIYAYNIYMYAFVRKMSVVFNTHTIPLTTLSIYQQALYSLIDTLAIQQVKRRTIKTDVEQRELGEQQLLLNL